MKKIVAGIMALCICGGLAAPVGRYSLAGTSITACAEDAEEFSEGTYESLSYKKYSDHVEISNFYGSTESEIIIPDTIEELPVTAIGRSAFFKCKNLTSITIPNGVTEIKDSAFYECSSLTSIIIPDGVTLIGRGAFYECTSLTSITIPNGVTEIENDTFDSCTSLISITIPDSVTEIGMRAFFGCTSLTSITIPDGVKYIRDCTFSGCTSLASITIPDSVKYIEVAAFSKCTNLASITIPDSIIHIGDSAFSDCTSLTSITISNRVNEIGSYAFSGCTSLTSITIPDSVRSINYNAFIHCSSLTSITIENPHCVIYCKRSIINNGYDKEKEDFYFNGTIYGYENSSAQKYAEECGYKFEPIEDAPAVVSPTEKIFYGDANCDDKVSIADSTAILQHLGNEDKYGLSDKGKLNADVDGVKGVTGNDAIMIQMVDAKLISVDELGAKKN